MVLVLPERQFYDLQPALFPACKSRYGTKLTLSQLITLQVLPCPDAHRQRARTPEKPFPRLWLTLPLSPAPLPADGCAPVPLLRRAPGNQTSTQSRQSQGHPSSPHAGETRVPTTAGPQYVSSPEEEGSGLGSDKAQSLKQSFFSVQTASCSSTSQNSSVFPVPSLCTVPVQRSVHGGWRRPSRLR